MEEKPRCETCKYFQPYAEEFKEPDGGDCHLNPPAHILDGETLLCLFPSVYKQSWCGKYVSNKS